MLVATIYTYVECKIMEMKSSLEALAHAALFPAFI